VASEIPVALHCTPARLGQDFLRVNGSARYESRKHL
jgi:hypothetical protein